MKWKRRLKIGFSVLAAVLVAAGLWFARPMTLGQICPGLELTECREISVRYQDIGGAYFDDTDVTLYPGDPGFDQVIELLGAKFSRSPFWWIPSGGKFHRWNEGDFRWDMDLIFEDVELVNGTVGFGTILYLDNFFGELDLRSYDGNHYPLRTSGQKQWVKDMMDIFYAVSAE